MIQTFGHLLIKLYWAPKYFFSGVTQGRDLMANFSLPLYFPAYISSEMVGGEAFKRPSILKEPILISLQRATISRDTGLAELPAYSHMCGCRDKGGSPLLILAVATFLFSF